MTDASDRFQEILTQSCRIERSAVTQGSDLDMEHGTFGLVGRQRQVKCVLAPLRVGDEMIAAAGPIERDMQRVFLPVGTDVEAQDQLTIDDVIFTAIDPPDAQTFRGDAHHIELLVERKAVQDEY